MRFPRILVTGAVTLALASTMVFAAAHDTPEAKAVKARQGHMGLNSFNLGTLGAMAKGTIPFDAAAAQAAADNLASLASLNQMAYWPAGSSSTDIEGSKALPAIWEMTPDVIAKAEGLATAAMAMQAAAGSLEGIQANIGAVGGACGACHKAYRVPNN